MIHFFVDPLILQGTRLVRGMLVLALCPLGVNTDLCKKGSVVGGFVELLFLSLSPFVLHLPENAHGVSILTLFFFMLVIDL